MHDGTECGAGVNGPAAVLGLFAAGCRAWLPMARLDAKIGATQDAAFAAVSELQGAGLATVWPECPGGPSLTLTPFGAGRLGLKLVRGRWRSVEAADAAPRRSARPSLTWDVAVQSPPFEDVPQLVFLTGSATIWRERHKRNCRCVACLAAWPGKVSATRHPDARGKCSACGGEPLPPRWVCGRCDAPVRVRVVAVTEQEREDEKREQARMRGLRGGTS
jgi:hypothetical protein